MSNDVAGPDGSALSEGLGPLPQPAMLRGVDEDYYTAEQMRAYGAQERAAERERIERDVADLHMTQATNNQNCPRAWHDGIDAALEVIRGPNVRANLPP